MKKSIDHITQARLLEELRIKSAAIDSAVNGIAFGDLEGRVTYANAAALELIRLYAGGGSRLVRIDICRFQEEAANLFAEVLGKGQLDRRGGRAEEGRLAHCCSPVGKSCP